MKTSPTKRRIVFVVLGACALFAVAVIAFWPGEKEPEYQGKKLSEWCEIRAMTDGTSDQSESAKAIRHIGTNALPFLMRWIGYDGFTLRPLRNKLSIHFPVLRYHQNLSAKEKRHLELRTYASFAFRDLGDMAKPVVPQLTRLFYEPKISSGATAAAVALAQLANSGLPTFPILREALTNANPNIRLRAVQSLFFIEGHRRAVNRAVINAMQDPVFVIRRLATNKFEMVARGSTNGVSPDQK